MRLLMSTSFHPQMDGASEHAIRNVGQLLRSMISLDQKDWVFKLPLVKFVINSSVSASTGYTLFKLNYGYMPHMTGIMPDLAKYKGIRDFAVWARANLLMAHDAIIEAHINTAFQSNKHWGPEISYVVGQLVYLSTKNLTLPKNCAWKLAPKYIGPFKVAKLTHNLQIISWNFCLS